MKILLFGATGMVGQGVLRECLRAADVERVVSVGRTATGVAHPKLQELVQPDLGDLRVVETELTGFDACFFCLGVSAAGMTEAGYGALNFELPMSVARMLSRRNPAMTFVYVSGAGTDGTERGRVMWARVKGRTENALQQLPFKAVYLFRPGVIQPLHGARSKTGSYRWLYALMKPLLPALRALFPNTILSTESVGLAMLQVARHGAPKAVLEPADLAALGRSHIDV